MTFRIKKKKNHFFSHSIFTIEIISYTTYAARISCMHTTNIHNIEIYLSNERKTYQWNCCAALVSAHTVAVARFKHFPLKLNIPSNILMGYIYELYEQNNVVQSYNIPVRTIVYNDKSILHRIECAHSVHGKHPQKFIEIIQTHNIFFFFQYAAGNVKKFNVKRIKVIASNLGILIIENHNN